MPTIKDKLHFNYDGKSSKEFGLINVDTSNGMFEESITGSREIIEVSIAGNDRPYFNRVKMSPKEFDMNIAFSNGYTEEMINEVVMWLFQDRYKPLFFEESPDRLYYCTPVDEPSIIHNGLMQGYITIRMRCDSPYVYSPIYKSEVYDLSTNTGKFPIVIENKGHFLMYPEISIIKVGSGHVTITDITNAYIEHPNDNTVIEKGFKIFEVRDLIDKEKIYINNEKELIETDAIGQYRYSNVIGNYHSFPYGKNTIEVEGKCHIQFRYQYKLKF